MKPTPSRLGLSRKSSGKKEGKTQAWTAFVHAKDGLVPYNTFREWAGDKETHLSDFEGGAEIMSHPRKPFDPSY